MPLRDLFDPAPGTIYLDAATYGLPPRPTVEALDRALRSWQAGTASWVEHWDRSGEACRSSFASLVGAEPAHVALMPTVSVGVGLVAASLRAGTRVVSVEDEFTSVLFPLLVQQANGVKVQTAPFDQLADAIAPATGLVAFSLVQSQSGRLADLPAILKAAERVGAAVLVDATHGVPFVPLAEHLPRIDYLVCAGYKHLLTPRGVTFLAVHPRRWDTLAPIFANWRSASDPYSRYYGGPLDLARDASRFDVSLAWFSWVAAAESLALLERWSKDGALAEPVRLATRLASRLGLTPTGTSIVAVPVRDAEAGRVALAKAGIKAAVRAGGVRLSTHVWNDEPEVERAAAAIQPLV